MLSIRLCDYLRGLWICLPCARCLPDEELFNFQRVELVMPAAQIMSRQNARTQCSQCGEEIINERQVMVNGQVLCQTCAYGGYYVEK